MDIDFYACRQRERDEVLPWDTVSCGVDKRYFVREYNRALAGETTPDCRKGCTGCGMNKLVGGKCPCEQ